MSTRMRRARVRRVGATWRGELVLLVGVIAAVFVVSAVRAAPLFGPSQRSPSVPQATPLITREPLRQAAADPLIAKANATRDRLKFPVGVRQSASHVHDASTQEDYDEVDELDSQGHPVSQTTFSNLQLRTAIRFDTPPQVATPIDQSAGTAAAQQVATDLALVTNAPDRSYSDPATGGWYVQWDRTISGVPVRGDGTQVRVWADGRIAAVSQNDHALAAAPSTIIAASAATQRVKASMGQLAAGAGSVQFQTPFLEWVRPNGTFDGTRPIGGEPICRLAWVVNVEPSDTSSSSFTLLTFFVDAGDGTLLGGDVVE